MAEFCKEYGFDFVDFSIKDVFDNLEEGTYIGQICEGMGFLAIAKQDGECLLAFSSPINSEFIVWYKFDFILNKVLKDHEVFIK